MHRSNAILMAVGALLLAACGDRANDAKKEIEALRGQVNASTTTNAALEKRVVETEAFRLQLNALEKRVAVLGAQAAGARLAASSNKSAAFDSQGDKAYGSVETTLGRVLFVLEKLEPYLDGYAATFRVGNPTSATLNGFEATVSWGPMFDAKDESTWTPQTKEVKVSDSMPPGSWSLVTINIGPATPQQARSIEITPRFNNVSMRTVQR
jgi:hypothetical protein